MIKIKVTEDKTLPKKSPVRVLEAILTRKYIGRIGESAAEVYLKSKGHLVLGKNVRFKKGEIDLISKQGDTLHVVEVKTGLFYTQNSVSSETIHPEEEHIIPEDSFSNKKITKLKYLANRVFVKFSGKSTGKNKVQVMGETEGVEGVQIDGIAVRIYAKKTQINSRLNSGRGQHLIIDRVTARYYPAL